LSWIDVDPKPSSSPTAHRARWSVVQAPGASGADPLPGVRGEPCWTPFMVLSKMPLHRRPRRASTPGLGLLLRLRPGAASPGSRSALVVSHDFGGFLRACGAGLLRPAADHGVHLVSGGSRPLAPGVARPKPRFTGEVRAVSIPGDQEAAGMTASRRGCPDGSGPMGDEPRGSSEEEPPGSAWSRRTSDRFGPGGPDRSR
jgi:hypothetical protein